MKKVSIIVTAYNKENTILMALDSIPPREDLEVIVIDDCSTDKTYSLITKYDRMPLKIIKNKENLGEGLTRNVGFDNATGEYLYAIDGDDWLYTLEFVVFLESFLYRTNYDIIRVPIKANYSEIYNLDETCCAFHTMFIKRDFMGDIRCPDLRYAPDKEVDKLLRAKNPKTILYPIPIYHYNYPCKGSLTWNYFNKKI